MLPVLLLLFIVVPLAELAVIIQVGQEIGVWWTIAILLADSILGSLLLRTQGRRAWQRFTDTLSSGRPPAREVLDGALVLVGGVLLLTPGFITDVVGFAFLLPPSRALIRGFLGRRLIPRMVVSMVGRGAPRRRSPGPPRPGDVDGTAVDAEPPPRLDG